MTYGYVEVPAGSIQPGDEVLGWVGDDGVRPPEVVTEVMFHPNRLGTVWIKTSGTWFFDGLAHITVSARPTFTLNRATFAAWTRDVGHHEFDGELVVDLRSGSYTALGRLPGAVTVDVVSERPDGSRAVVSHFNKAHKGRLARVLAAGRAEPDSAAKVATAARRAGMTVERDGNRLTVVTQ